MVQNTPLGVFREPDDVREVCANSPMLTPAYDLRVSLRIVLCLVSCQKCLSVEAFCSDKHFEASRSGHKLDQLWLASNLRVTLTKESDSRVVFDHCGQQLPHVRNLVEVVRREGNHLNAHCLGSSETGQGSLDSLSTYSSAGDLDDRAEVTSEWTSPGYVHAEHGDDVAPKATFVWCNEYWRIKFLSPSLTLTIDRLQLSFLDSVEKNGA